jgi:hypothetical protein
LDRDRFLAMLDRPDVTKSDLLAIRDNVMRRNELMHLRAVEEALDRRFSGWGGPASRRGGAEPTEVFFRGMRGFFDTQKDAYIWLIERFIEAYPKPFVKLDWETVRVAKGPRSLYFSRSLKSLFGESGEHLAADPNNWHCLTNGWYAKVNLSQAQKLALLHKFAVFAKLKEQTDWTWSTDSYSASQASSDALLRELAGNEPSSASIAPIATRTS